VLSNDTDADSGNTLTSDDVRSNADHQR
jgi:hypothetical protein